MLLNWHKCHSGIPYHGRDARDTVIQISTKNTDEVSALHSHSSFILSTSSFLCLALVILLTGCQAAPPAAKFIEQADRLDSGALASTVVVDTDLNDYVQQVANRIAQAAKTAAPSKVNDAFIARVRCQLVNCNVINAVSTGGTHVYVTSGLFRQCQTEEELAAAIAHAYAHLIDRDLETTKMKPDPAEPLSMVAWDFVANRFTREQEHQADALALAIFAQAGYDPSRFSGLFDHMETMSGGNVAPDREPLPERAAALLASSANMTRNARKLPVADPKTFISLRDEAAQIHEPAPASVPLIFLRAIPNCILSGDTREQREAQERLKPVAPPPQHPLEPS
jgi:Zn-dependent protease with chaperone function